MAEIRCIWSGCKRAAVYLAYSTVGCGHGHSCEAHAPAWLKAGAYSRFYSPRPVGETAATWQAIKRGDLHTVAGLTIKRGRS